MSASIERSGVDLRSYALRFFSAHRRGVGYVAVARPAGKALGTFALPGKSAAAIEFVQDRSSVIGFVVLSGGRYRVVPLGHRTVAA